MSALLRQSVTCQGASVRISFWRSPWSSLFTASGLLACGQPSSGSWAPRALQVFTLRALLPCSRPCCWPRREDCGQGQCAPSPSLCFVSGISGKGAALISLTGVHVHLGPTSWGWGRGSRLCGAPRPRGACELSICPDRVFCTDRKCGWTAITGLLLADQQVIHVTHTCLPRTLCCFRHWPPPASHF